MLDPKLILLATLAVLITCLIFGGRRWRYDALSMVALAVLVLSGVIKPESAFEGFSHPAVVLVALVLIISKGLQESGFVNLVDNAVQKLNLSENNFLIILLLAGMGMSSFMNNIGAMAILLPITIATCHSKNWKVAKFLMPLAFACILGGMNTVIGTPPNLIVSEFREQYTGSQFTFFDFSHVGIFVSFFGVLFIAFLGYKFIYKSIHREEPKKFDTVRDFLTEFTVKENSPLIGKKFSFLEKRIDEISGEETEILGRINKDGFLEKINFYTPVKSGDVIVLEAQGNNLALLQEKLGLTIGSKVNPIDQADIGVSEYMIGPSSTLIGKTHADLKKLLSGKLALLGLSRKSKIVWPNQKKYMRRLTRETFQIGDVLLLGVRDIDNNDVDTTIAHLGLMALNAKRKLQVIPNKRKLFISLALFGLTISATVLNLINILPAFLLCILGFLAFRVINGNLYKSIEWPVIVLLAAMIPIGSALETTGITNDIVLILLSFTNSLDLKWIILIILLLTMLISDFINNAATAVVMTPIAANLAIELGAPIDPFLMAVAIGASCAFLSPIGHQCNALIMGPGNYKFGDYWKLGLPLEILIAIISVPMILYVWG